jgi:hypothetical protein
LSAIGFEFTQPPRPKGRQKGWKLSSSGENYSPNVAPVCPVNAQNNNVVGVDGERDAVGQPLQLMLPFREGSMDAQACTHAGEKAHSAENAAYSAETQACNAHSAEHAAYSAETQACNVHSAAIKRQSSSCLDNSVVSAYSAGEDAYSDDTGSHSASDSRSRSGQCGAEAHSAGENSRQAYSAGENSQESERASYTAEDRKANEGDIFAGISRSAPSVCTGIVQDTDVEMLGEAPVRHGSSRGTVCVAGNACVGEQIESKR